VAGLTRIFSNHFLANSLKPLIGGTAIENIINNLEKLQKKETVKNFENYIIEIIEHLEDIRQLRHEKSDWERLYQLSKIMSSRGYQLNSITLLFEAVGFYCLEAICSNVKTMDSRKREYQNYIKQKRKPEHISFLPILW